jgi:hypothetical protein
LVLACMHSVPYPFKGWYSIFIHTHGSILQGCFAAMAAIASWPF